MAHHALENELHSYARLSYVIRSRLYKGLVSGRMSIASLYDDERARMKSGRKCAYCGSASSLSLDHLVPRSLGGSDSADNLVYACRSCNSSKGDRDLLVWYASRDEFPPLFVLRRYLKLLIASAERRGLLDAEFENCGDLVAPFRVDLIPLEYPQPDRLRF